MKYHIIIYYFGFCKWLKRGLRVISVSPTKPASKFIINPEDRATGLLVGKIQAQKNQVHNYVILVNQYRNQSNVVFGGDNEALDEEEKKKREEEKKKKEEELNKKLPNYDPKLGGKSSVEFGNDAPDYRRKN